MLLLRFLAYWHTRLKDTWLVYITEIKRVITDPGVVLIFFGAGLAYPIVYNLIYYNNILRDVPVAVVDMSATASSRDIIHKWDATPEVQVCYACSSMDEARDLMMKQKIHGILYIPSDYNSTLSDINNQTTLSLYCDMSSFLYLKNVALSANFLALDEGYILQKERYTKAHMDPVMTEAIVQGAESEMVSIFNPSTGYAHSLVPIVLVLIVYQTLFFGIVMLCGTARENNSEIYFLPGRRRRYGVTRIILGRSFAYFTFYIVISSYCLILVPRMFDLPHVGNPLDIMIMMVPFLFSTIFLAMNIGSFIKERETGMVLLLFTSLILIFLAGASWPSESTPTILRWLSYLLPSTWGIHGYLHINSMGSSLTHSAREYVMLWVLFVLYGFMVYVNYLIRATVSKTSYLVVEWKKHRKLAMTMHRKLQMRERQFKELTHKQLDKIDKMMH